LRGYWSDFSKLAGFPGSPVGGDGCVKRIQSGIGPGNDGGDTRRLVHKVCVFCVHNQCIHTRMAGIPTITEPRNAIVRAATTTNDTTVKMMSQTYGKMQMKPTAASRYNAIIIEVLLVSR
jgi:hypothetical protein